VFDVGPGLRPLQKSLTGSDSGSGSL
jgi:hypothetical protein